MSELKVINAYLPTFDANHNEMILVSHTKENYVPAKQMEFYLKSEADKVIAELETKLAAAQLVLRLNKSEALYCNLETMSRLNHKIDVVARRERHQKYKRCLAMAMWCRSRACFYDTMRENSLCWGWKSDRAYKWYKRWLELAEKFKE